MSNVLEATQAIYAAFGQGDIPRLMEFLAEDVGWEHWENNSAQAAGVAWLSRKTGKAAVGEFFAVVAGMRIHEFQVLGMMASETQVAVEVAIELTTQGGKRFRDEELHLWSFDSHGKVVRLRHYVDTAKHIEAASAGV